MNRTVKIFKTPVVLFILIVSILFGFIADIILTGIDRLIYPEDYYELVSKYAKENSVPEELVFAIIKVESDFKSDAKSHAGAVGLMQMIPSTYEWLASKRGEPSHPAMLYDPEVNIKYGTYYLQYLYLKFGTWEKTLVAYNWGEGNFMEYIEENGYEEGDYKSLPVRETREYVKKVLHHWEKYNELYE